jgi:Family of unknown function (DUF5670)
LRYFLIFETAERWALSLQKKETAMLWTLAAILFVLWGLGLVTSVTAGGLVHLLLVGAVVIVLVRVISGRRIT